MNANDVQTWGDNMFERCAVHRAVQGKSECIISWIQMQSLIPFVVLEMSLTCELKPFQTYAMYRVSVQGKGLT